MKPRVQTCMAALLALASLVRAATLQAQGADFHRASNDYYTATIADLRVPGGSFLGGYPGAFTGPLHPVNARMGGRAEILGTHWVCADCGGWNDFGLASLRIYSERADITLGNNINYLTQPEVGYDCFAGNDLFTPIVEEITGPVPMVRATWFLTVGGANLSVRREMRVQGGDIIDSCIESSLYVENVGVSAFTFGLRDAMALRLSLPLGPTRPSRGSAAWFALGLHPPAPAPEPLIWAEEEWVAPTFRMWQAAASLRPSANVGGYSIGGAIAPNGVLNPPPTPPTLLQYTTLNALGGSDPGGGAADNCFTWRVPNTGRNAGDFYQMAMVSYWGHDAAHAITVAPGEEVRFTQYLVTFEDYPLTADAGADTQVECGASASVPLAGSATTITPTASDIKTMWSSVNAGVTFDDASEPSTVAHFPGLGSYELTFTAVVGAFTATDTVTVNVIDTTPPRFVRLSVSPANLWPPNHRLQRVAVTALVADDCDAAPAIRLISVASNEPDEQRQGGGDGATTGDIAEAALGTDDRSILLRAERSGTRAGRIYTLTYEVVDASGNVATGTSTVSVRHDQGATRPRPRGRR